MPNCFLCRHHRPLPGSAHLACHHPKVRKIVEDPGMQVLGILGSVGRVPSVELERLVPDLGVQVDPVGARHGWANWPMNFDPVWILSCNGFEREEEKCAGKTE